MKRILSLVLAILMIFSMSVLSLTSCGVLSFFKKDPVKYSVRFETNGGTAVAEQQVESGSKVSLPVAPTKENCSFKGWYTDNETFEYKYDFTRAVYEDIVLYAKWENLVVGNALGENSDVTTYSISNLKVDRAGNKVSAVVNAPENCAIIVRFLYEDAYFSSYKSYIDENYLYASRVVPAGSKSAELTFEINNSYLLPTYFVAEAFLINADAGFLCEACSNIENTQRYQEFASKTLEDFEEDDVILNFDNTTNNNFGVLADDVKAVSASNITITDVDGDGRVESYTLTDCSQTLYAGDKVFAYSENVNEIFRVLSVSALGNSLCVIPAQADDPEYGYDLSDFYKFLKVNMTTNNNDTFETLSSERTETLGLNVHQVNENINFSKSLSFDIELFDNSKFDISGEVNAKISLYVVFEWDVILFGRDYMRFDIELSSDFTGKLTVAAKFENEQTKDVYEPATIKLGKIDIPIGVTGLSSFIDMDFELNWEITAGFSAEYSSTMKTGFHYNTIDGVQKIDERDSSWSVKCGGEAEIKFGPAPKVGVRFLAGVLEADLKCFLGVVAQGEVAAPSLYGGDSKHCCSLCIEGKVYFELSVTAELSYNIIKDVLSASLDFEVAKITKHLFDFYISIINSKDSTFGGHPKMGTGKCENKEYKVTLVAQNELGDVIDTEISVYKSDAPEKICTVRSEEFTYLNPGTYIAKITVGDAVYQRGFAVNNEAKYVTINTLDAESFINGSVFERMSNEPIANATVIVYEDGNQVDLVTTAEDGTFKLSLEQGTYKLEVYAEGYVSAVQYVTLRHGENKYIEPFMLAVKDELTIMGGMYGEIKNALTGERVPGVEIKIVRGWVDEIDESSEIVTESFTDESGAYSFAKKTIAGVDFGLDAGNYTVVINKEGYISNSFKVIIVGGEDLVFNSTLTPLGAENVYHIVLTWGENPDDLDSHLNATYEGSRDHVYYSDMTGYYSNLDVDDTTSYGPETITILDAAAYSGNIMYSVHDYTNRNSSSSNRMSYSNAKVQVYRGGQLVETFYIPTGVTATVWNVFYIDSENRIHAVNTFENKSDPVYVYGDEG